MYQKSTEVNTERKNKHPTYIGISYYCETELKNLNDRDS